MNGAQIRRWADKVFAGEDNWFRLVELPTMEGTQSQGVDFLSDPTPSTPQLDWDGFMRGWIRVSAGAS
jgi:hypothetical protein